MAKTIKFSTELTKLVKEGTKTATFRILDDKDLQTGDKVIFAERDGERVTEFGEGELLEVYTKAYKDLNRADWVGHEHYDDLLEVFKKFYGDSIDKEVLVKVVRFKINKFY
ncbi:MAG: ASCH domain-containing protein [Candidatus Dojkabacteria bacterium]|nr:ASCH domain-containing protein [Candidatus Dojkabacteria bacterium]MDQ7021256.1 ASCH domain-containing protein [Candidatus Dojkabacteria bacterium]